MKTKLYFIFNILYILILTSFTSTDNKYQVQEQNRVYPYLSDLEAEVISELNLARSNPEKYVDFLTEYSNLFIGNALHEPGKIILMTKEGKGAVLEAIKFLKSQKEGLPTLIPSQGMSKGARDMVQMQEETTHVGHIGEDGSTYVERISRYGTWQGSCSENIDYGNNSARRIVMALIIDDGVGNRGHRKSVFNPDFRVAGVSCGNHATYRYMCVIEYAAGYKEK